MRKHQHFPKIDEYKARHNLVITKTTNKTVMVNKELNGAIAGCVVGLCAVPWLNKALASAIKGVPYVVLRIVGPALIK